MAPRRAGRRSATSSAFAAPVQRCIRHEERNVLNHLAEHDRPALRRRLREAWKLDDHVAARERLQALAVELDRSNPGAAGSLREGLDETLTVTRLGIRAALRKTLASTNPRRDARRRTPVPP